MPKPTNFLRTKDPDKRLRTFKSIVFPDAKEPADLVVPDSLVPGDITATSQTRRLLGEMNGHPLCEWENGKCRRIRISENLDPDIDPWSRHCCVFCQEDIGALHFIPESELAYYEERWDDKTGFWRGKYKGCALDTAHMSAGCLAFLCPEIVTNSGITTKMLNTLPYLLWEKTQKVAKRIKKHYANGE